MLAGFYAGIAQWQNDYPTWRLGGLGYAKRFGAAYADQAIGNYLTEAILPALASNIAGFLDSDGDFPDRAGNRHGGHSVCPYNIYPTSDGWIAVIWIGIITILFCLPEVSPVSWHTFNYAPIAVGIVLAFSGGWWLLSARNWFAGPHRQGNEAELEAIEERARATAGR